MASSHRVERFLGGEPDLISATDLEALENRRRRESAPAPPTPPQAQEDQSLHQYKVRLLDDTNTAVEGVKLKLEIDGTPKMPTTDTSGLASVQWFSTASARAHILDQTELERRLDPRWDSPAATVLPKGPNVYERVVGSPFAEFSVPADSEVTVVLVRRRDSAGELRVDVSDANTGGTVAGATVEIQLSDGGHGDSRETLADGSAVFSAIPAGTYTVRVSHELYPIHEQTVELPGSLQLPVALKPYGTAFNAALSSLPEALDLTILERIEAIDAVFDIDSGAPARLMQTAEVYGSSGRVRSDLPTTPQGTDRVVARWDGKDDTGGSPVRRLRDPASALPATATACRQVESKPSPYVSAMTKLNTTVNPDGDPAKGPHPMNSTEHRSGENREPFDWAWAESVASHPVPSPCRTAQRPRGRQVRHTSRRANGSLSQRAMVSGVDHGPRTDRARPLRQYADRIRVPARRTGIHGDEIENDCAPGPESRPRAGRPG